MPVPMPVMNRAIIRCGSENAEHCRVAPTCNAVSFWHPPDVTHTYNDEGHGKPHRFPSTNLFTDKKIDDASCKHAQVVDADDDSLETAVGVAKLRKPVWIRYDTAEYSLIVTKEDECHLTCYRDRYA